MNNVNIDEKYYKGFEGEPEMTFLIEVQNEIPKAIGIWEGYFSEIIKRIEPSECGWNGLAYYYHLDIGWFEECPWLIPNLQEAYEQLKNISLDVLGEKAEKEIVEKITDLMREAMSKKGKMYILYDV